MTRPTVRIKNSLDGSEATVQPSAAHVWLSRGWTRVDDGNDTNEEQPVPPVQDQNEESH